LGNTARSVADPACHFDADPDPDPAPSFHIKAQNLEKVLKYVYPTFWLVICKLMLMRNVDPDPAYHFDADPDPAFQFDSDPDQQHCRS
jgi:hypothetical protein